MKNYIALFILFPLLHFAQNDVKLFNEVNLGYNAPSQIENTFIKQGYRNNVGLFLELQPVSYKNFGLLIGVQYNDYMAMERSLTGNISSARQTTPYFKIVYQYEIISKLNVNPFVGYGSSRLKEVGVTNGQTYFTGTNLHYNFYEDISLLVGVQYSKFNYDVKTNSAEKFLFESSSNVQLNLGFNFRFSTL